MLIVYYRGLSRGWTPINYMVTLAAEIFEAELLILDSEMPNIRKRLEAAFLGRQSKGNESCLLVCPNPTYLLSLFLIEGWNKRFRYIAAWIIDSFWLEWIPKFTRFSHFDHLFVTSEEDISEWERLTKTSITWLPWGTDALRLGGQASERNLDLLRVGRQPPEWDDDVTTSKMCLARNLRFHGRPKGADNQIKNQEVLMSFYRQTKFMLAFSNAVNPTSYTHPRREYLTARWVDALACGAVVAGIAPKEPSINRLLWDGATLDLGSIRRDEGLAVITEAVHKWSIRQAEVNYQNALKRLDWRWRFSVIADVLEESPARLNAELQLLNQKIEQCAR